MRRLIEAVIDKWRRLGAQPRPGASPSEVQRFEALNRCALPGALRELLLQANGTTEAAPVEFAFLGIGQYFSPLQHDAYIRAEVSPATFVFVDYMSFSWAYAVEMNTQAVFAVGLQTEPPTVIADSVEEFLQLYLVDDSKIRP